LLSRTGIAANNAPTDAEYLRNEIFTQTGIVAVNGHPSLSASILESVEKVLVDGLPPGGARKLRALHFIGGQYSKQALVRVDASYFYDGKLIAISDLPVQFRNNLRLELCETIAHEVGHAAAFSLLTGSQLVQLAKDYGPWQGVPAFDETIISLWDARLRQRHPDFEAPIYALRSRLGVPSRYALESAHEWFAEIFSVWVMENIQKKSERGVHLSQGFSVPPQTAAALANLFDRLAE
jgi:hypothetical protein